MDEIIYCPKCEGTQHKHNPYNPNIHHPLVSAAQFLVSYRRRPFSMPTVDTDEDYVPESYCCKSCGHTFLAPGTYVGELRYFQELRKKWLFWGLICAVISLFFVLALIFGYYVDPINAHLILPYIPYMLPSFVLSYIFLGGVFHSAKECQKLQEEWTEFQNVQAKYTKTINNNYEEHIPAWKRVQEEPQNQGSE